MTSFSGHLLQTSVVQCISEGRVEIQIHFHCFPAIPGNAWIFGSGLHLPLKMVRKKKKERIVWIKHCELVALLLYDSSMIYCIQISEHSRVHLLKSTATVKNVSVKRQDKHQNGSGVKVPFVTDWFNLCCILEQAHLPGQYFSKWCFKNRAAFLAVLFNHKTKAFLFASFIQLSAPLKNQKTGRRGPVPWLEESCLQGKMQNTVYSLNSEMNCLLCC